MLIAFKLCNFRSFLHQQTFSFVPSADDSHRDTNCIPDEKCRQSTLLRTAILFGANGSGKSGLLAGLVAMRELVLNSPHFTDEQFSHRYTPFKFGGIPGAPTEFSIDVLIEQVRYRYCVSYDAHRIVFERLLVWRTGKAQRWFERGIDSQRQEQWAPFSPGFHGLRCQWRKATRPTALFLSVAAQDDAQQLQPLRAWFDRGIVLQPEQQSEWAATVAATVSTAASKDRVLRFMRRLDCRIEDVRVVPGHKARPYPVDRPHARLGQDLAVEILHRGPADTGAWLGPDDESSGLLRLLGLSCALVADDAPKGLLMVDEFGKNLHPLVCRSLIDFLRKRLPTRAQTPLVSHDATLMDLELFRRDEIWLLERDSEQGSVLTSLLRRRARKRGSLTKKYLRGHFGGVPRIRSH